MVASSAESLLGEPPTGPITNTLAERQRIAVSRETLDNLAPRFGDVIVLRHFHGLSLLAICRRLDLSQPTAKSRLHRGLRMTAQKLKARLDLAA